MVVDPLAAAETLRAACGVIAALVMGLLGMTSRFAMARFYAEEAMKSAAKALEELDRIEAAEVDANDDLVTPPVAAERLGLPESTVRYWCQEHAIGIKEGVPPRPGRAARSEAGGRGHIPFRRQPRGSFRAFRAMWVGREGTLSLATDFQNLCMCTRK